MICPKRRSRGVRLEEISVLSRHFSLFCNFVCKTDFWPLNCTSRWSVGFSGDAVASCGTFGASQVAFLERLLLAMKDSCSQCCLDVPPQHAFHPISQSFCARCIKREHGAPDLGWNCCLGAYAVVCLHFLRLLFCRR